MAGRMIDHAVRKIGAHVLTPSTSTSSWESRYVLDATASARRASAATPSRRATIACWCRIEPVHDPDGATMTSTPSNVSAYCRISGSAARW